MSRAIVMILIFVLSLTVLVSAPHAQGVPPSDRSTGDGGPIQADQYGPPLGVGKAPIADKRSETVHHPILRAISDIRSRAITSANSRANPKSGHVGTFAQGLSRDKPGHEGYSTRSISNLINVTFAVWARAGWQVACLIYDALVGKECITGAKEYPTTCPKVDPTAPPVVGGRV